MRTRRLQCCVCLLILTLLLSVLPVSAQEVPTGMEEAAVTLREGLKNREESIQVIFRIDPDSFDGTQDSAIKLADQITALAYAHTGVPDEGDYLRHSIWFIQPTVHYARLSDCWQFTISYYMRYFANAPQEAELDPLIEDLVEELELKRDLTDYQKVSAIYNYICGSVAYDYETLEDDSYGLKWSAYAAVVNKTAVCQGYATLFYRLCLEAGIDNRVITGMSVNPSGEPERHAWNLVKLDGAYYYLDTTWDAGAYQYQWFLKTAAEFTDHEPDPEFMTEEFHWAYPLSELFYQHPFVPNGVEGDFEYQVTNGAAALISYKGDDRDVTVPAQLGGYPVRWIGQLAFFQNNYIESLTFSEGIRVMESEAIL